MWGLKFPQELPDDCANFRVDFPNTNEVVTFQLIAEKRFNFQIVHTSLDLKQNIAANIFLAYSFSLYQDLNCKSYNNRKTVDSA